MPWEGLACLRKAWRFVDGVDAVVGADVDGAAAVTDGERGPVGGADVLVRLDDGPVGVGDVVAAGPVGGSFFNIVGAAGGWAEGLD